MTVLEASECHSDPALDISGQEDQIPVLNDHLEVGVEELEDRIQVRF